ncbi:MAG: NAD-dependent dehydratase [Candidatus Buchananbacteria bacterium RIFCSPHIGHO2_02_FULL_38_8]|uniref:UDP-glucuronate decarboxylase n=2 Tax=Candidatus Buchananiibacteriota TaxID=1817903 RepID=A0A1G1XYA3_9BACT|nr:MAG: NAD-dependent dehydratase [Candidatus Buchananbacteria bacterium RIFCSPHIGHO2_01_FULL_39_8]OGY47280.1 MAG: NAD-dependent dehydratase [Candidatus Buchananbacteria bacterium RIFCSPHIGHO2_02_FULL_38_8]
MGKILVTGGAGFIGSHLCKFLLDKGYQVVCLDNFFTGQKSNIISLLDNQNFKLVEQDIIEPFYLEGEFDQVYNLACPASPIHYQKNAIRTIKTSTIGMINVLGFARHHGSRILQASTSEVYGDPLEHPQKETYNGNVNPIGPRACYDEGKRVAETLMFDYYRMHGMDIRVARIFNTYGPNMTFDDGRVVSNFIVQALRGEPITIYGQGTQTRSFCYVSDLVRGLYALMESDIMGPVNLGNPAEFTIKELAKEVIKLTGSSSEIIYQDLPQDDPKQRRPDISLAKERLSWQPTVELKEGLPKTIEYFKKVLNI